MQRNGNILDSANFRATIFDIFLPIFHTPLGISHLCLKIFFYPSNAIPYNIYRYGYNASATLSLYVLLRLNTNNGANPIARLAPFVYLSRNRTSNQAADACIVCGFFRMADRLHRQQERQPEPAVVSVVAHMLAAEHTTTMAAAEHIAVVVQRSVRHSAVEPNRDGDRATSYR